MDLGIIFAIIAGILIFGTVLKVLKFGLKIISLIFLVLLLISLGFGFVVYKDLSGIQQNWPDSDKIVLLANDEIYAGMITTFSEGKEPAMLENIESYQTAYQNKNYELILGSNYLLFIFKLDMFEKNEEQIDFSSMKLSQASIINAIESSDSIEYVADELVKKGELDLTDRETWKSEVIEELGGNTELKGMLFGVLLQNKINDPLFVFKQYSKGNVIIYPESATFKLIKAAPFSLIEGVASKVIKE